MLERSERVLKIACAALAVLLCFQLFSAMFRHNPLEHAKIPALPALAATGDEKAGGKSTNSVAAKAPGKAGTNATAMETPGKAATNSAASKTTNQSGTKAVSVSEHDAAKDTNSAPDSASAKMETNSIAGTNLVQGTNLISGTNAVSGTNAMAQAKPGKRAARNPRPGAGKKAAELPPVIQARIDKITDSEILGPVIRPVPTGLLGIAGEYAFLRAPSGQTGMVKTGDELGGIKLLQIGVNRVLVEESGEKKELTIFEGYGGETLLPKSTDKPNETITKTK